MLTTITPNASSIYNPQDGSIDKSTIHTTKIKPNLGDIGNQNEIFNAPLSHAESENHQYHHESQSNQNAAQTNH